MEVLAAVAVDYSGAEIEQAVISALYRAAGLGEKIDTRHIIQKIQESKPLAVMRCEDITALRAWATDRTVPVD